MSRKIIVTGDNSKTLLIPALGETYHSTKGALTESKHVFIKEGLFQFDLKEPIKILEMGFGTGLNVMTTLEAISPLNSAKIDYHTIEKYPLSLEEVRLTNYDDLFESQSLKSEFTLIHEVKWNEAFAIRKNFKLTKMKGDLASLSLELNHYDLIYYDAFGPKVQPDLWSEKIMNKMFDCLKLNGILVTYCAQGQFKRNLKKAGFKVESIPGPPGKREMTRALKTK